MTLGRKDPNKTKHLTRERSKLLKRQNSPITDNAIFTGKRQIRAKSLLIFHQSLGIRELYGMLLPYTLNITIYGELLTNNIFRLGETVKIANVIYHL